MQLTRNIMGARMNESWVNLGPIAEALAVAGTFVAFVLRPINKRLDSHARQLAEAETWKMRTAETMSRTVALLDQMENRMNRIEDRCYNASGCKEKN